MKERTALGEAILNHWREHCPQMVRDLEKSNRLEQAVFEAQSRTGDLLYELVSVKKMDYQAAWELATQEWALPDGGEPTADRPRQGQRSPGSRVHGNRNPGSPDQRHRAGNREAAAGLPDKRGAPDRAGRAEGKGPRQHRGDPHAQD